MDKRLYNAVRHDAIGEYPFNELTPSEWLRILHHLDAHEIECPGIRARGINIQNLESPHTMGFFFSQALGDYLFENNGRSQAGPHLFAPQELDLREKALRLYRRLKLDYEMKNVSTDPNVVVWDVREMKIA